MSENHIPTVSRAKRGRKKLCPARSRRQAAERFRTLRLSGDTKALAGVRRR